MRAAGGTPPRRRETLARLALERSAHLFGKHVAALSGRAVADFAIAIVDEPIEEFGQGVGRSGPVLAFECLGERRTEAGQPRQVAATRAEQQFASLRESRSA